VNLELFDGRDPARGPVLSAGLSESGPIPVDCPMVGVHVGRGGAFDGCSPLDGLGRFLKGRLGREEDTAKVAQIARLPKVGIERLGRFVADAAGQPPAFREGGRRGDVESYGGADRKVRKRAKHAAERNRSVAIKVALTFRDAWRCCPFGSIFPPGGRRVRVRVGGGEGGRGGEKNGGGRKGCGTLRGRAWNILRTKCLGVRRSHVHPPHPPPFPCPGGRGKERVRGNGALVESEKGTSCS